MRGLRLLLFLLVVTPGAVSAAGDLSLTERARQYLAALLRLDTTNPPGRETRAAQYLKSVADAHGIPCELLGGNSKRLNFVARLKGSGKSRPLLLMAHTDVVAADRAQWTADPFGAEIRNGAMFGRGAVDDKSLLAAELAVLVEVKRRAIPLSRDIILLAEADEEAGSTGIQWMVREAWPKIDAEFAINEGGIAVQSGDGRRVYQIQTAEKVPSRVVLTAKGTAGHGSLPRPDNPVVRLSRALVRLAEYEHPVRLNQTTRQYLRTLSRSAGYHWLAPLLPRLEDPSSAGAAANEIRSRSPEMDAMLRTSVSPTMLRAGVKINVIPNTAEAQVDVRRLPNETREEILNRFRHIVNDPAVTVASAGGQQMPATQPSSLATALYKAVAEVIARRRPGDLVVPFMSRGATDGSYLRAKGMAVYGVPLFLREGTDSLAHGNDEHISLRNLDEGVELLWQIVMEAASVP